MSDLVCVHLVVEKKNKGVFKLLVHGELTPGWCKVDFGKLIPEPPRREDPHYFGGKMDEWRTNNWGSYGAFDGRLAEVSNYFVLEFFCYRHYPGTVVAKFAQESKAPFVAFSFRSDRCFWGVDFWDEGEMIAWTGSQRVIEHPLDLFMWGSCDEDGNPVERIPTLQEVLDLAWEHRNDV